MLSTKEVRSHGDAAWRALATRADQETLDLARGRGEDGYPQRAPFADREGLYRAPRTEHPLHARRALRTSLREPHAAGWPLYERAQRASLAARRCPARHGGAFAEGAATGTGVHAEGRPRARRHAYR